MEEEQNDLEQTSPDIAENNVIVIAVAASAGGLEAFKELVGAISPSSDNAFILLQHMNPSYETVLAHILQYETTLQLQDFPVSGKIEGGHIYVVPSGKLLVADQNKLTLVQQPRKHFPLHSIDSLFEAVAEIYQAQAIGVLMSGTGSDGTGGLKKIKDNGGVTIVQQPGSARFPAMPQHAVDAGIVDFQIPAAEIPARIAQITKQFKKIVGLNDGPPDRTEDEMYFKKIIHFLRLRRETDFTYYKQTTVRRRILRRMVVNQVDSLEMYCQLVEDQPAELDVLYDDLLIPVTNFFRDSHVFNQLCEKVLPDLFRNRNLSAPLRIWVAGCSTGEEAYSLAICLYEFLGEAIAGMKLQIFGTDISEKAIRKARSGMYTIRDVEGVGAVRLATHFVKIEGVYHLNKNIRDLCVFADHNFLTDPPFARMDMVSCRNVLIYMNSYLQSRALSTFHYALNETGILLLGMSETTGSSAELFVPVNQNHKLFRRKTVPGRSRRIVPEREEKRGAAAPEGILPLTARKEAFEKNADAVFLAKYTPAAVVVNDHFDIVQFRGDTGPFLSPTPGKASFNLLKMSRDGLAFELRAALHKAREGRETVIKENISISQADFTVSIEVTPLLQSLEMHFLVVFRAVRQNSRQLPEDIGADQGVMRINQLEMELAQLREDMRSVTEQQEAAFEELQSANEELLSGSEELQTINEELETSKEELQSANEELTTVNQELNDRNEQYNLSRLYAEAIVNTIREPLLVLDKDLRVRNGNPAFYEEFALEETEVRGKILFELQKSQWDIAALRTPLLQIQTGELKTVEWKTTFNINGREERLFLLKAQPVKPQAGSQLILLAFEDITLSEHETERLTRAARDLKEELQLLEDFFTEAPALFCILKGPEHRFEFANPRYEQLSGGQALKGKKFADAFPESGNEGYKKILDDVYASGKSFSAMALPATIYGGQTETATIFTDLSVQPYKNAQGETIGILLFAYEVTELVVERKKVEASAERLEQQVQVRARQLVETNRALEQSNKNLQGFVSIAAHDLQEPLRKIRSFIGILRKQLPVGSAGDAANLLEKIESAAQRMAALIKGVLNYSRISSPEKNFEQVDLAVILQNVLEEFELLIHEKRAMIFVHAPLSSIDAIATQMMQLFQNLIGNALKFGSLTEVPRIVIQATDPGPEIFAEFPDLNPGEQYLQITFTDNGIGFEPEYAEQIFSIFERLHNHATYEGTGIGLALCRRIAELHRGKIVARANEKPGSSFRVILPKKQHTATD